jgi:hypothetical protein
MRRALKCITGAGSSRKSSRLCGLVPVCGIRFGKVESESVALLLTNQGSKGAPRK